MDVADVVRALRVAVGLEDLRWKQWLLRVEVASGQGSVATMVRVTGWPGRVAPEVELDPACELGSGADRVPGGWVATCVADPSELPAAFDLATISYRAPDPVVAVGLTLEAEGVDSLLDGVDVTARLAAP